MARAAGLRTFAKKDSQEICFVPSNDYRLLLKQRGVELHPGRIVDVFGKDHGPHNGTENFTIGQRRGHGVAVGVPMYVVEIHPAEGLVVIGSEAECKAPSMQVEDLNWLGFDVPSDGSFRCAVQVRYRHRAAPATVQVAPDGLSARVDFDEPQMAVAPGQGAAFYELEADGTGGDLSLGGGWIREAQRGGLGVSDVEQAPVLP